MQASYSNLAPFTETAVICLLNKSANFGNTTDRKLVWQLQIFNILFFTNQSSIRRTHRIYRVKELEGPKVSTFLLRKTFSRNIKVLKFLTFDIKAKNHTLSFSHSLQLAQNKLWLSLAFCNSYTPHSCIKTHAMSKASTSHHCLMCVCVCVCTSIHIYI